MSPPALPTPVPRRRAHMCLPSSIFLRSTRVPWYSPESMMPDTVNTPPTIAHTDVTKCRNEERASANRTCSVRGQRAVSRDARTREATEAACKRTWIGLMS